MIPLPAIKAFFAGDWIRLGVTVAFLIAVFLFGMSVRKHYFELPKVAELKEESAAREKALSDERIKIESDLRQRLEKQVAYSALLSAALQQKELVIENEREATKQQIRRLTVGRDCLSADAVRVLNNQGATAVPSGADQGASARRPAEEDAGAAATDTDIGIWIADAKAQYAQCARRLDGWQQWYDSQ